jgi:hypothetical protein
VEADARGRLAEVGGLGEVVVAGCSFMLMAIEKYEVRYPVLSSLGDSLAESHSLRFLDIQIRFTRTRVRQCASSVQISALLARKMERSAYRTIVLPCWLQSRQRRGALSLGTTSHTTTATTPGANDGGCVKPQQPAWHSPTPKQDALRLPVDLIPL